MPRPPSLVRKVKKMIYVPEILVSKALEKAKQEGFSSFNQLIEYLLREYIRSDERGEGE